MSQQTVDVDISKVPELGNQLLTHLNKLREHAPIKWSDASQCWLVTGHEELSEAFGGSLPLSNHVFPYAWDSIASPEEQEKLFPKARRYTVPWVTNTDRPEHTRLRMLLMKGFKASAVESLRPFARARIEALLDQAEGGAEVEFNESIARQLTGSVIVQLLGLPQDVVGRLRPWAEATTIALGSKPPRLDWMLAYEQAVVEQEQIFLEAIEERRHNPREDLINDFMNAASEEGRLSQDEMIGALILVNIAGHESTMGSLTLTLEALARHPDKWRELQQKPDIALAAANELMRYAAMSASMPRVAAEDFEWRGNNVRRGDLVMLMIAGGNRDPSAYPSPEAIDFSRTNRESLVFGAGPHFCIGHLLAKMQVSEMLAAVTRRFDGAEILEDLHFMPQVVFRGVTSLRVRMKPRAGN
jgi:pimeloyl-[acyl-carrier protein] synthase